MKKKNVDPNNPDGDQQVVYMTNVQEEVQATEESEDSEVVGAGGEVNLGALGFQEEIF